MPENQTDLQLNQFTDRTVFFEKREPAGDLIFTPAQFFVKFFEVIIF